jgi:hypothetical protein
MADGERVTNRRKASPQRTLEEKEKLYRQGREGRQGNNNKSDVTFRHPPSAIRHPPSAIPSREGGRGRLSGNAYLGRS